MGYANPEDLKPVKCDTFTQQLVLRGFRKVVGCNPGRTKFLVVFILAPMGEQATEGPKLAALLRSLSSEPYVRSAQLSEIIVLMPDLIYRSKKNITGVLANFHRAAKTPGRENGKFTALADVYNAYPYSIMTTNLFEVKSIPRVHIASPKEFAKLRRWLLLPEHGPVKIPLILENDPMVAWLGGRPGQFVAVAQPSQQTAVYLNYRQIRAVDRYTLTTAK